MLSLWAMGLSQLCQVKQSRFNVTTIMNVIINYAERLLFCETLAQDLGSFNTGRLLDLLSVEKKTHQAAYSF